ncbi:MAG: tyrosine-type recombinase/integrase [Actinomycetia bacterium]|nr:tyrosine-type recombinase/integrase [Actinomycetes bacterium]
MLHNPAPPRRKALPCLTEDEVSGLLGAIGTSTAKGKRDNAIVRLALGTGLRNCDIVALTLDDISWRADEIRLAQGKTSEPLALPLLPDVGNAIADYILNARPESEDRRIFLHVKSPHVGLSGAAGPNIAERYFAKAGIAREAYNGKTFHALRRTAGTRLVKSGAGTPMTAQILGQRRVDSAKRYIALDDGAMRECCLPLERLASRKEGLQ